MATLKTLRFLANEVIFQRGDHGDCAYIVEEGTVSILSRDGDEEHLVGEVNPGELFGEMALLDCGLRSATATAKTDVKIIIIHRTQITNRFYKADPVIQLIVNILLKRIHKQLAFKEPAALLPELHQPTISRMKLESELETALGTGEICLFLQPIADIDSGKVAGFEALARWRHPERGLIPPDQFIKLAEETGFIIKLGQWILHEACRLSQYLEHRENIAGVQGEGAFISINISVEQIKDEHFFEHLKSVLKTTGIPPHRVKLEITESILMNIVDAKEWINRVHFYGVSVTLDDFGTGYSSLSCLHEYNLDGLKIDQSFINKMLHDQRSWHIVKTIVDLSKILSLEIIAEGIETTEHLKKLKEMSCKYAQGYIISKPIPVENYFISAKNNYPEFHVNWYENVPKAR